MPLYSKFLGTHLQCERLYLKMRMILENAHSTILLWLWWCCTVHILQNKYLTLIHRYWTKTLPKPKFIETLFFCWKTHLENNYPSFEYATYVWFVNVTVVYNSNCAIGSVLTFSCSCDYIQFQYRINNGTIITLYCICG